tara:strand:+ start:1685 stop:2830 length:1146 start_codon:yes stop_codon:yes gene_type:complete
MENTELNPQDSGDNPSIQFISDAEVSAASQSPEPTPEPMTEPTAASSTEPTEPTGAEGIIDNNEPTDVAPTEPVADPAPAEPIAATEEQLPDNITGEEVESAVFQYLSDKLGRDITSVDDLTLAQPESKLDERLEAIARFVEETGRDPQDWFRYQQMNPAEMDDLTAIKIQMLSEHNNLTPEELNILLGSKYKLDADMHSDEEMKLSQLQLKLDASAAREKISGLRDSYLTPTPATQAEEPKSLINDSWIKDMKSNLNKMTGIEFDLAEGKSFTFGLTNEYKSQLAEKNTHLDEYFNSYVQKDGSWDYDKLNMHRSIVDNMETIVKSVYTQGIADGKRGIVDQAANVTSSTPNQGVAQPEASPLAAQLRSALGYDRGFGSN